MLIIKLYKYFQLHDRAYRYTLSPMGFHILILAWRSSADISWFKVQFLTALKVQASLYMCRVHMLNTANMQFFQDIWYLAC